MICVLTLSCPSYEFVKLSQEMSILLSPGSSLSNTCVTFLVITRPGGAQGLTPSFLHGSLGVNPGNALASMWCQAGSPSLPMPSPRSYHIHRCTRVSCSAVEPVEREQVVESGSPGLESQICHKHLCDLARGHSTQLKGRSS